MLFKSSLPNHLSLPRIGGDSQGFTIIELLIATFVIGTVMVGMFGLFVLGLRGAQDGERRVVAVALANERMEMIRNLPYVEVGTSGGVPSGSIEQSETVTRNGLDYTVATDIRYVDDEYDGLLGEGEEGRVTICHQPPGNPGGQQTMSIPEPALQGHLSHGDTEGPCPGDSDPNGGDTENNDYKRVRVEVSWNSPYDIRPVLLITDVAPQGIEESELNGTLSFQALNALGEAVEGATVTLFSDEVDPDVDLTTQTDSSGRVLIPGLLPAAEDYELTVSLTGYTAEQTYDETASFFPDPDHTHLTMIARQITEKTFFIDLVANLDASFQDESLAAVTGLTYTLQGTKRIGQDDQGELVYEVEDVGATDAAGQRSHSDLVWDSYNIEIDGPTELYDIKETDPPLPLALNPGDTVSLTVTVTDHTPISAQVTVLDETESPVDNADVQLTNGSGFDETLSTGILGQVYFGDLPADGEYTLDVIAPGFGATQEQLEVEGTTRTTVEMLSS